jgi:hypothetical protein
VAHILKHIPTARRDSECCKIAEVNSLLSTSTENVHGVIHKRGGMTLAGYGNITNTIELGPCIGARFIRPDIVEPCDSICTTEAGIDQRLDRKSSHVSVGGTYR